MFKLNYSKKICILKILSICGLFSSILLFNQFTQTSYEQTTATNTLNIKAELDKKVVKLGDSETIKFTVTDSKSKQPVSGVLIKAVVNYPGGKLIKVLNTNTDMSGHSSLNIPTDKSVKSDTVNVEIAASLTGFTDTSFSMNFAVISKSINRN